MLMVCVSPAVAQRASVSVLPPVPATAVLTNFEKMSSSGRAVIPDEVRFPDRYSVARVDTVLSGLERIARMSYAGLGTSMAVSAIMEAGSAEHPPTGIFEREIRLYRSNNETVVRSMILSLMPRQSDRQRALAFLKSVATQSGAQRDYEYAPFDAAEALGDMGSDGRAALIGLRDRKLIRDARTAGFVHWFLTTKL